VGGPRARAIDPDEILPALLGLDPGLRLERYWGERAIFHNPGGVAPLGVIFAAIKDHDGPNDRSAKLSRDGVYRFAFGIPPDTFARRFGEIPARPAKGGVIAHPGYDPTRIDELMPHPVYGWMSWVQILAPTAARFESLSPLLGESLDLVRAKWKRRHAAVHHVRHAAA
jgi:hypothetical protein